MKQVRIQRQRSFIMVDGMPVSNEEAVRLLLSRGLVMKAHRSGTRYCPYHMISYPVDVWGDINRCPLCGRPLRTNPRARKYREGIRKYIDVLET